MRIFRHVTDLPAEALRPAVALGNFDGVHCGHRAVIGTAVRIAASLGAPSAALTFEPHPRSVFRPDDPPFRLTPFRTKAHHIEAEGVQFLHVLHFDHAFAQLSAEEFVMRVLVEHLRVCHVVVGYDFVFGKKRAGDAAVLARLAEREGFGFTRLEAVRDPGGEIYSSTRIRKLLVAGRPDEAARLLGRHWEIDGRVEHGDERGRRLGFPTANLELGEYQQPALGVYAVRAGIDKGGATVWHDGVANLGRRPTFDGEKVLLEVHLLDAEEDLYGQHLRVAMVEHLRPEKKFDGLEALRAQIAEDCRRARQVLAKLQA